MTIFTVESADRDSFATTRSKNPRSSGFGLLTPVFHLRDTWSLGNGGNAMGIGMPSNRDQIHGVQSKAKDPPILS